MQPMEAPQTNSNKIPQNQIEILPPGSDETFRQETGNALEVVRKYAKPQVVTTKPERELPGADTTISYKRRSNTSDDDGASEERQDKNIALICRKHGLPLPSYEFFDAGITGATTARPGYQSMKTVGAANRGANLVVEYVDRAIRSDAVGFDFGWFVIDNEIRLFDMEGPVSHERLLREINKASGTHRLISERNRETRARMNRKGTYGPRPPFGYDKPLSGYIVPNEKFAPVVRTIFRMFLNGSTPGNITRWLGEQGYKPPIAKYWIRSTVTKLLKNPIYVGITQIVSKDSGEVHFAVTKHTQIVPVETFDAVQAKFAARKERPRQTSGSRTLLAGKMRCPKCGAPFERAYSFRSDEIIRCSQAGQSCDGVPGISRCASERIALNGLIGLLGPGHEETFMGALVKAENQQRDAADVVRNNLDQRIAEEEAKIARSTKKAHEFDLLDVMGDAINESKRAVASMKFERARHLSFGFGVTVSERLRGLVPAIEFLKQNVPLQRVNSDAEECIATTSALIRTVLVEHLDTGKVRQTTVYDFNSEDAVEPDSSLVHTVVEEYDPPCVGTKQKRTIEWLRQTKVHTFDDAEFERLSALVDVRRAFGKFGDKTLRQGFDSIALSICGNYPLAMGTTVWLPGKPGDQFRRSVKSAVANGLMVSFVELFKQLRPTASAFEIVSAKIEGSPSGHVGKMFRAPPHPILQHPICQAGGRETFTAAEWKALITELASLSRSFHPNHADKTRVRLEAYFSMIRENKSWPLLGSPTERAPIRRTFDKLYDEGTFDRICRILLTVEGVRSGEDNGAMPAVPGLERTGTRGEAATR